MDELAPHQQRVVDEKAELDTKIERLRAFISGSVFQGLDIDEQSLLTSQIVFMSGYSFVLGERVSAWMN